MGSFTVRVVSRMTNKLLLNGNVVGYVGWKVETKETAETT